MFYSSAPSSLSGERKNHTELWKKFPSIKLSMAQRFIELLGIDSSDQKIFDLMHICWHHHHSLGKILNSLKSLWP
jgi:hypothetical protein